MIAGCAGVAPVEHLPALPLLDDRATVTAISAQFHAVHDMSAQGNLDLTGPNGDRVQMDVAMALRPPNEARVRAYKFGQAVFDLTVTPSGVWLLTTGPGATADRTSKLQVSAEQLAHMLGLLSGALFEEPGLVLHDDGDGLIVRRERSGEATVLCTVDRKTRTVRQYQLLDDRHAVRLMLTQSEFVEHDGIPWPQRILAVSDRGRIEIQLRDVDLNAGLPPNAFVPPRRATRLP